MGLSVYLGLDYAAMAKEQATNSDVLACQRGRTALRLEDVVFDRANATLPCDVSTNQPRPLIPAGWCRWVFDSIHGLSHRGVKATANLVGAKFVWSGLKKDISARAGACVACQRAKVQRHTKGPLAPFVVPEKRFDHWRQKRNHKN